MRYRRVGPTARPDPLKERIRENGSSPDTVPWRWVSERHQLAADAEHDFDRALEDGDHVLRDVAQLEDRFARFVLG